MFTTLCNHHCTKWATNAFECSFLGCISGCVRWFFLQPFFVIGKIFWVFEGSKITFYVNMHGFKRCRYSLWPVTLNSWIQWYSWGVHFNNEWRMIITFDYYVCFCIKELTKFGLIATACFSYKNSNKKTKNVFSRMWVRESMPQKMST